MEKRGNISVVGVPPADESVQERLSAYQNTRNSSFAGFLHDDGLLITTRFADSAQVHHVRMPLGQRRQMTFFREPVKICVPSPKDGEAPKGFIFGSDIGGNEQLQLSFFDSDTATSKRFTDGTSKHDGPCWAAEGNSIAFSSNARDGKHFDVYLLAFAHVAGRQEHDKVGSSGGSTGGVHAHARLVMENSDAGYFWTTGASTRPDGSSTLLVHHYISVSDSKLYLVETDADHVTRRTKIAPRLSQAAAVGNARLVLSQDGARALGILYSCNEGTDFLTLRFYDVATQTDSQLCSEAELPWDVEAIAVDATSGIFVVAHNVDGSSQLRWGRLRVRAPAATVAAGASVACPTVLSWYDDLDPGPGLQKLDLNIPGVIARMELSYGAGGQQGLVLGFSLLAANAPMDVYTIALGKWRGDQPASAAPAFTGSHLAPLRWTESEVGGLHTSNFVTPDLVRITSFDGLSFSAFVYRPPTSVGSKRKPGGCPVIVHPHGGPEGQHRPVFSPMIQFLACELGVCVIDPNVRGSDGYGKVFVNLDNGYNREDSVKDIGALLDWIDADASLDSSRVAVWGGSYGGYMVLASLVHYSARLKCGIDMVGISNFVTFLENTADYRRDLRRLKYGDERQPDMRAFLTGISPLTNVAKIQRPLFIIQGANDPRVPLSEAEQIHQGVQANGQEAWYMVAADEGHGFAKKANVDQYQTALVAFVEKFLLS